MAMHLDKELPCGITASYHRILAVSINLNTPAGPEITGPVVSVEVGEYLSKEARDKGLAPIRTEVRTLVMGEEMKAILAPVYARLSEPMDYEERPVYDPADIAKLNSTPGPELGDWTPAPAGVERIPLRPCLGYEGACEV